MVLGQLIIFVSKLDVAKSFYVDGIKPFVILMAIGLRLLNLKTDLIKP